MPLHIINKIHGTYFAPPNTDTIHTQLLITKAHILHRHTDWEFLFF